MKRRSLPHDNQFEENLNVNPSFNFANAQFNQIKETKNIVNGKSKISQFNRQQINTPPSVCPSSQFFNTVSNQKKQGETSQTNYLNRQFLRSKEKVTCIPEELQCPITLEIMVHPVLCILDGITYEEKEIREFIDCMFLN